MASFKYEAIDKTGKVIKATLEADNAAKAHAMLKEKGYTVSALAEATVLDKDINIAFLERKPKARDRSVFCRQFVTILRAGVPVVSALDMLSVQTENKRLARALRSCKKEIETGETLAASMAKQKGVFSEIFCTMTEAGEASGSLENTYNRLALQEERDARMTALLKKSLTYPVVILFVAIGIIVGMLAFVIPRFQDLFSQIGSGSLPAITLSVIAMSDFVRHRWYILLAIVALLVLGFRYFQKTESGKLTLGTIGMKMPLFGKLVVKTACAKMSRTLCSLTAAGLPLIEALEITAKTLPNIHFRRAISAARDDAAMGTPLSESLKHSGVFPPLVPNMIAIGEEAGSLDEMLTTLADYYEQEVEETTAQVMAALEPMIIIVLAVLVLYLVLACLMPMLSLYDALDAM